MIKTITPKKKATLFWLEMWEYKDLLFLLSWRDILVRYKQTVLGVSWSIIRPLISMVIFTIVFGEIAGMKNPTDAPYSIVVYVGLLPWLLFSNSINESSNSLVGNSDLISKIYFPRILIPLSSVATALIDFTISFILFLGMLIYYSYPLSSKSLWAPFFIVVSLMFSTGLGFIISSLNVTFRDFRYVVPFMIQVGLYISPVGFTVESIPSEWRIVYFLNPMVGIINGFRWAIINEGAFLELESVIYAVVVSVIVFILGIKVFFKMEKSFADRI